MKIVSTYEFNNWYKKMTVREKAQVDARIARVEEHEHLGDWKYIANGLAELRWKKWKTNLFYKIKR